MMGIHRGAAGIIAITAMLAACVADPTGPASSGRPALTTVSATVLTTTATCTTSTDGVSSTSTYIVAYGTIPTGCTSTDTTTTAATPAPPPDSGQFKLSFP